MSLDAGCDRLNTRQIIAQEHKTQGGRVERSEAKRLGSGMAFSILYLRGGKLVADTTWTVDIPPSCHFVRYSLTIRDADTAIITDDDGQHLIVEKRLKFDA